MSLKLCLHNILSYCVFAGQQNIPMPPRPSSGQSDGSGPTRMSHSPMATQSGYQQPLAPPSHMHPYKMGAHPGMVPPGGQQMAPYTPQGQQYPQGMDRQCRSSANTVALWNVMSCTVLYLTLHVALISDTQLYVTQRQQFITFVMRVQEARFGCIERVTLSVV